MYEQAPKSGQRGNAPGYINLKDGVRKSVDTKFYESQGTHALSEDNERVNNYAKPGTSAFGRQEEAYEVSYPSSRYRSRRP